MVERFREKLTNESLTDRIARMVADLEGRAGGEAVGTAHEDAKSVFARADMQETASDAIALDREDPKRRSPRERRRPRRTAS